MILPPGFHLHGGGGVHYGPHWRYTEATLKLHIAIVHACQLNCNQTNFLYQGSNAYSCTHAFKFCERLKASNAMTRFAVVAISPQNGTRNDLRSEIKNFSGGGGGGGGGGGACSQTPL